MVAGGSGNGSGNGGGNGGGNGSDGLMRSGGLMQGGTRQQQVDRYGSSGMQ